MAIWMDMTNSLHAWRGGVVGIVRAELEIAKNLKKENSEVRFFKYDGTRFLEIPDSELAWLWECASVGDAYLTAMGRSQTAGTFQDSEEDYLAKLRKQYPGLDNAYNYANSRLKRGIWGLMLYTNTIPRAVRSLAKKTISLLSRPLLALSAKRAQYKEKAAIRRAMKNAPATFSYPFQEGDTVFSCGWMCSGKEEGFERVKEQLSDILLIYLIYDIILVRENTRQFYHPIGRTDFGKYLQWVSFHCDITFCGGETAAEDLRDYQKDHLLPVTESYPVRFGSDIVRKDGLSQDECSEYLRKKKITEPFIMAVGSIDERKNYATLYRAMTILAERGTENVPQLVIVGKGNALQDLLDTMQRDPLVEGKIILVSPTDAELDCLYRNAAFVVLSSAWEGWSLTLPEAMQYHKLVLVSDVPPLREVGEDFVVYIDPYDPFAWADQIAYYSQHPDAVSRAEEKLKLGYTAVTWRDCGTQVNHLLTKCSRHRKQAHPVIYMDISLAYHTAIFGGNITGILRTELMLIRHIFRQHHALRFFALTELYGYESIDVSVVAPVILGDELDADYRVCQENLRRMHTERHVTPNTQLQDKEAAFWFLISTLPRSWQEKCIRYGKAKKKRLQAKLRGDSNLPYDEPQEGIYDVPFREGDIVLTAGTGAGTVTYPKQLRTKAAFKYLYCPVLYDFTPLLMPQIHMEKTTEAYGPFIEFNSKMADLILYGGETARQDGIAYQRKKRLPQPRSCAIRFGSDIDERTKEKKTKKGEKEDVEILERLGIDGPFIMAVGTMEIRKNHETLYRAYLRMLENYDDIPQMVFAGHPGWKTKDFLETMARDDRIRGKILQISPTDEELDLLYRSCEFTVLASMYEGWSLTLPESYWYRKFCLCCDTPALKETAGDLAEYIHRWDEKRWAERIYYYHSHPEVLDKREAAIQDNWHSISWSECAGEILKLLKAEMKDNGAEAKGGNCNAPKTD